MGGGKSLPPKSTQTPGSGTTSSQGSTQTQQLNPANPAHLGQLPGGGNQAVLQRMQDQLPSARIPLPSGTLAAGTSIDALGVLAAIEALWAEVAVWGDDPLEQPQGPLQRWGSWLADMTGDIGKRQGIDGVITPGREKTIGNFGGFPAFGDTEMEPRIASILTLAAWNAQNCWTSGVFSPCLGTTGSIKIGAYLENQRAITPGETTLEAGTGGSSGSAHEVSQGFGLEGAGTFEASGTTGSQRESTGAASAAVDVSGGLVEADLVFRITLEFSRVGEGRFGPKTIEVPGGIAKLIGVGLG